MILFQLLNSIGLLYSEFQGGYTHGVGVGGNPAAVASAPGTTGGPGLVKIKYLLDKTFERESYFLHFLFPSSLPLVPSPVIIISRYYLRLE